MSLSKTMQRGYKYYLEKRIKSIQLIDDTYHGEVIGESLYHVTIKVSSSHKVLDMSCTCPYAAKGYKCKHMIAMMIEIFGVKEVLGDQVFDEGDDYYQYYDEDDEDEYYHESSYNDYIYDYDSLMHWLELKNKSDLLKICESLIENKDVYNAFLERKYDEDRITEVNNSIHVIRNNQWNNTKEVINQINRLMHHKQYEPAIETISKSLLSYMSDFPSFNENQHNFALELFELLESFYDEYKELVRSKEVKLCQHPHQFAIYMINHIYMRDDQVNEIVNELEGDLRYSYHKVEKLNHFIDVSYRYNQECLNKFTLQHQKDVFVMKAIAKYCFSNISHEDTLKFCEWQNQVNPHIDYFYELIIEIYKADNQTDKIKDIYYKLLFDVSPGDIEVYKCLQSYYTDEQWNTEKHKIMNKLKQKNLEMCDIYIYEYKHKALFTYLANKHDMYRIKKYEHVFKKYCSYQLVAFYKKHILSALKNTNTREYYREIGNYLRIIYQMNKKEAKAIYNQLISLYPNRPAMKEELWNAIRNN